MVRARRGSSRRDCLVPVPVVVAVGYFGTHLGAAFLRSWRFEEAMRQEARFAPQRDDPAEVRQ